MSRTRDRRYFSGFNKSIWWQEKRYRLYDERGGICEICGGSFSMDQMSLHHKVARSKGGRDIDQNIQLVCNRCHRDHHKNIRSFENDESIDGSTIPFTVNKGPGARHKKKVEGYY